MCEPITGAMIGQALMGAVATQAVSGLMGGGKSSTPQAPAAPAAPPQATKQPDQAASRTRGAAGTPTSATMLTGAAGVDPASLALGKNTLLGA
jgi:hypothetical protein